MITVYLYFGDFSNMYLHSMEIDWYREIPEYLSVFNESGQAWEWEDEQGFSALRHSGEKSRRLLLYTHFSFFFFTLCT